MTNDDVAATWAASNSEPHHLFAYRHAVELLRGAAPGVGRHGSSKVWDMLREAASFALSNRMALPNWRAKHALAKLRRRSSAGGTIHRGVGVR